MKKKDKAAPLPPRAELQAIYPRLAPHVREVKREAGRAVLVRGDAEGARHVELDAMGLDVMQRLDGQRSLEEIRAEFAAEHALSPLESRALVLNFLRSLRQRGLVDFHSQSVA